MLKELIALTETPLGQKATKPHVSAAEEDLARLATPSSKSASATASGVERSVAGKPILFGRDIPN